MRSVIVLASGGADDGELSPCRLQLYTAQLVVPASRELRPPGQSGQAIGNWETMPATRSCSFTILEKQPMSIRGYGVTIAMSLIFVGSPSYGQSASCFDEMEVPGRCLPWGYLDLTSVLGDTTAANRHLIVDLSRDGSTLAGFGLSPLETFRWKPGEGIRVFNGSGAGISNPKLYLNGPVMSETGSFIAADGLISGKSRVFRWDVEAGDTSALVLPIAPAGEPSQPDVTLTPRVNASISGNGQTIVGQGEALFPNGSVFSPTWPFVWTNASGTDGGSQQDFIFTFRPLAVDGIGSRIVGHEFTNNIPPESRAVFWTASGGSSVVGSFPESRFTASSYDGEFLAGFRFDSLLDDVVGFRWTSADGMEDITDFGFQPRAISNDGNVISGSTTFTVNSAKLPVVWTTLFGAEHLHDYLFFSFGLAGFSDPVTHLNDHAIVSGDGNVFTVTGSQWVAKVSPLQAVAMGDSYSSGEGALGPNEGYLLGTDIEDVNECHRAVAAYGVLMKPPTSLVSYQLLATTEGTGFEWQFIACSGARTLNVLSTGIPKYPAEQEQLDQSHVNADTDLVTITIGGNDALFALVLDRCVRNFPPTSNCFDEVYPGTTEKFGDLLEMRLIGQVTDAVTDVYEEIKSKSMDNATVVALGYPLLLSAGSGCIGAPLITNDERNDIRRLGVLLNQQLAIAARRAGVHFVREVADEFAGHNVCDSEPWILGAQPHKPVHSFHPTPEGQLAYARVLEKFFLTRARLGYPRGFFESGMPRNPAPIP